VNPRELRRVLVKALARIWRERPDLRPKAQGDSALAHSEGTEHQPRVVAVRGPEEES
jgi:hypothetical protein